MYGAILGDIIGSPYEFDQGDKTKEFPLFSKRSEFTDDTVMTIAVADVFLDAQPSADIKWIRNRLIRGMQKYGKLFPYAGYGGMFRRWLKCDDPQPYGSFGNGSAMRVSAVAWLYNDLETVRSMARLSAEVSHNHPEGIKGAQAIASAIFLARSGRHKKEIKRYIENNFNYDLSRTCDDIRPKYSFNECCQTSCPEAIIAFLDSHDYESAIRLAVSLGGDADTLACMAGGIAAAYYGVPQWILKEGRKSLTKEKLEVVNKFDELTNSKELVIDKELD
jgi:ADP-ribosylglycohydrolase